MPSTKTETELSGLQKEYDLLKEKYDSLELKYKQLFYKIAVGENAPEKSNETFAEINFLYENAVIAYHSLNAEGFILKVNKVWLKLFEYNLDEVIGRKITDFFDPAAEAENFKNLPDTTNASIINGVELKFISKSGRSFFVSINGLLIRDNEGNFLRTHCLLSDITERKKTEASLLESEKRYRQLYEKNPQPMMIYEISSLKIISVNRAAIDHYGFSEAEFLKMRILDLHPEEERDEVTAQVTITGCEVRRTGYWNHTDKFNEIKKVEILSHDLTFKKKKARLVMIHDVTEENRAVELLIQSEKKFRSIFENSSTGKLFTDEKGIILNANNAFCKMLGYSIDEVIGKSYKYFVHNDYLVSEEYYLERIFANQIDNFFEEKKHLCKDGTTKWSYATVSVVRDDNLRPVNFVRMLEDFTDKHNSEIALKESREKYKTVADYTSDWESWINENQKYEYISPACKEITGYSLQEFFDDVFLSYKIILEEDKYLLSEHYRDFNSKDYHANIEFRIKTKDGKIKWISHSCRPVFNDDGKWRGRRASNTDITERKIAEQELQKLYAATEQSPVAVLILDLIGIIEYANLKYCELNGETVENLKGKNAESLKRHNHPKLYKEIENTVKNDKVWKGELLRFEKNEIKYISTIISPIKDKKGTTKNFVVLQQDITELKKTEMHLRESELRYRSLFKNNSAVIILINPSNGKIWDMNDAAKELYGETDNIFEIDTGPHDYINRLLKQIESGEISQFQTEVKTKHNSIRNMEIYCGPINIQGNILIYAITHDITERKKAELELNKYKNHLEELVDYRALELKQSEQKYRRLLRSTNDSIVRFTKDLTILFANPIFEKIIGQSIENFIGKKLADLNFSSNQIKSWRSVIENTFSTKSQQRCELEFQNEVWLDLLTIPEYDLKGNIESVVIFGRDITKRKKLELKVLEALEKEKELNELKSRFVSMVSHEFRTPLTALLSSAELLEKYGRSWEEEKYLMHIERIVNSVHNLTEMLNDVLLLNKAEAGRIDFKPAVLNLYDFCQPLINDINSIKSDQHTLTFKYLAKQHEYILDEKLLKYILMNMLSNAVKYSPEGGMVNFVISQKNRWLEFLVSDEGIGINEKDMKNIFEPFVRGQNFVGIQGTGLGLSILKKSVELHSGNINIESNNGKGTTFKVSIPLIF